MKNETNRAKRKRNRKPAVYDGAIPVIGIGATMSVGSDCYPYTVTSINKSGKTITAVQTWPNHDSEGKITGYVESFEPGAGSVFTLRKNGTFYQKGSSIKYTGALHIGHRTYHQDPHF